MIQICRWFDPLMVDASWIKRDSKTRDLSLVIFQAIQNSGLFDEEKKTVVCTEVGQDCPFCIIGPHANLSFFLFYFIP